MNSSKFPFVKIPGVQYHKAIWIGIGIGISKIFRSVLGIESIGKNGISPSLVCVCVCVCACACACTCYLYNIDMSQ